MHEKRKIVLRIFSLTVLRSVDKSRHIVIRIRFSILILESIFVLAVATAHEFRGLTRSCTFVQIVGLHVGINL